jgi:hypothetical protein
MSNFTTFHLHRTEKREKSKRDSGGLIIYISDKISKYVTYIKHKEDHSLWIKLNSKLFGSEYPLLLCLCYNIPSGSSREGLIFQNIFDSLTEDIISFENEYNNQCHFLITGDFNARIGERADFVENEILLDLDVLPDEYEPDLCINRRSQDRVVNENGLYMLDFCKQTGMRVMNGRLYEDDSVGKFTCVKNMGSSVIDYVMCRPNFMNYFKGFSVDDPNILSDHCSVYFELGVDNLEQPEEREITSNIKSNYVWHNDKVEKYKQALQSDGFINELDVLSHRLSFIENNDDIDNNLYSFYEALEHICNPIFSKTTNRKSDKSKHKNKQTWFDENCREKRDIFFQILKLYNHDKSDENRQMMTTTRSEYKALIRKKKFRYTKEQTTIFENMRFKNAKDYWKLLKGSKTDNKPKTLDEVRFFEYFKSVNDPVSAFFQPDEDIVSFNERYLNDELQEMFSELNCHITSDELLKACRELKAGKTGGPDLVLNEFFKHGMPILQPYLLKLFNTILDNGYFPERWSEGYVIPIFKKGDVEDPGNYRGITLLSTLGKLFTRILNTRLNNWAENYHVYVEAQAGFRQNMSTVDNIFILHGLISHFLNEKKKLFVAFIDFKKAFDYVVRDNLWFKLIKYGVRGKILDVMISMYSKLKSCVKYNNCASDNYMCTLGVAQGECMSPFLFSMYLNDLEETLQLKGFDGIDVDLFKLFLLLYADDICLVSNTEEDLQNGLNILYNYCERWKLTVNTDKSKVMVFKKGGRISRGTQFKYNNVHLDIVNKFSYLGVIFTCGGSFIETQKALAAQALKAIFKLKSYIYKFTTLSVKHTLDLFDKLILPILLYGSEVTGVTNCNIIEKIHLNFCKQLLGVRTQTQNSFIYGELGRLPIKQHIIVSIIRYWLKVSQCSDLKYVKHVYRLMIENMQRDQNTKSWTKNVKTILELYGFNDVWLFGAGNPDAFIIVFKQRVRDNFMQNWQDEINNSTRADCYRLYSNFSFKSYLDTLNICKFRYDLTRFRLSAHRLYIETGRWHKPNPIPRNERKCLFCNCLEDEFHFLLECELYKDIRKKYVKDYY